MHTTFASTAVADTTLARLPYAVGRLLAVGMVLTGALLLVAL